MDSLCANVGTALLTEFQIRALKRLPFKGTRAVAKDPSLLSPEPVGWGLQGPGGGAGRARCKALSGLLGHLACPPHAAHFPSH